MTAVKLYDHERFPYHIIEAIHAICEYISRDARHAIVQVCAQGIAKEKEDPESTISSRWGIPKILAMKLGVDERTTQRWFAKEIQGCNDNIFKLIELSLEYSPTQTIRVIQDDLEKYRNSFISITTEFYTEVRRGAVAL